MSTESTHAAPAASEHSHEPVVVVNGTEVPVESERVTYEQVVKIAYPTPPAPDTRFTVAFRNAHEPKEGSLAPGQSVEVKQHGTIFNVKATGRS
jgi:hypothetical protein